MRIRSAIISVIYRKALTMSYGARKESTVGEIVNLMAVDANRAMEVSMQLNMLWSAPLQIALALYYLWQILGPSVLAGLGLMILMVPLNSFIANKVKSLQIRQMKSKDKRIKLINEVLNGIRVLKLYAWEPSYEKELRDIRKKEVNILKKAAYFNAATSFTWTCAPFLVSIVTFATFVLIDENNVLDAEIAFVSLSLFNIIRMPLGMIPMLITTIIQALVSLERINKFMAGENLNPENVSHESSEKCPLLVQGGTFSWGLGEQPVLNNVNLRVDKGALIAVVGTVGSGKSSLMSAILGEMDKVSGHVNTQGSIAFVPQQAWIQNASLKDNIMFGKNSDERYYNKVIEACALKPDFKVLPGGDDTEIGEKGINLSGGQKQRVSLARAVYNDADIYLLDDPLSAVDSHVGKHIFEKVIGPTGLLNNKTRVLVTHGITFLPKVDLIVVLTDGEVSEKGTYKELVQRKGAFADFLDQHLQETWRKSNNSWKVLWERRSSSISSIGPSPGCLTAEVRMALLGTPDHRHGNEAIPFQLNSRMSTVSTRSGGSLKRAASGSLRRLNTGSRGQLNNIREKDPDSPKFQDKKLIETERAEVGNDPLDTLVLFGKDPPYIPVFFGKDPSYTLVLFGKDPPYIPALSGKDPPYIPVLSGKDPLYTLVLFGKDPPYNPVLSGKDPPYIPVLSVLSGKDPPYIPVLSGKDPPYIPVLSGKDPPYIPFLSGKDPLYNAVLSGKDPLYNAVLSGKDPPYNPVLSGKDPPYNPVLSGKDSPYIPLLSGKDSPYIPVLSGKNSPYIPVLSVLSGKNSPYIPVLSGKDSPYIPVFSGKNSPYIPLLSGKDFPYIPVLSGKDFPYIPVLSGKDFPYIPVLSGKDFPYIPVLSGKNSPYITVLSGKDSPYIPVLSGKDSPYIPVLSGKDSPYIPVLSGKDSPYIPVLSGKDSPYIPVLSGKDSPYIPVLSGKDFPYIPVLSGKDSPYIPVLSGKDSPYIPVLSGKDPPYIPVLSGKDSPYIPVKWAVYKHYMAAVGLLLTIGTLVINAILQGFQVGSNVWLSVWSENGYGTFNSTTNLTETNPQELYLGVYGMLGLGQVVCVCIGTLTVSVGTINAANTLHNTMLANILRLPQSLFDTTPTGRLLTRFSSDVNVLDTHIPMILRMSIPNLYRVAATFIVISCTTPLFISVIVPVGILYYFIQRVYVSTSRQVKRLESISRAPVYSHFGESITGAAVIRAYGVQSRFIKISEEKVDFNQMCVFPNITSNCWLSVRLELIGGCITFFTSLFAVLGRETMNPGLVGLSVSYALQITMTLNMLVRVASDIETNIVAVERIKEYSEYEQEAPWENPATQPSKDWPTEGRVQFTDYKLRYREGLELVLKGLNFTISGGEKVGIVGRTGAGKSSLTLALFRIIEPAGGSIIIDGVDIIGLGLHVVRSRITIIPQDPVLFSGSLRQNLDPFNNLSDDAVWKAIEHAHLKSFVKSLPAGLNHQVSEGGENLSVGQRQLICLARALLRKTKVLVLDEATAAVDLETDDLIQATIRKEFQECTVLTIAHRLNTILDSNRVLVLDQGQVVEFDTPQSLLQKKDSVFYGMAKDAGLV
uniref:ABC-type glutathione-S-conjugate transporter n=1 Tax=Timema bartmani TaxID=61472 RepID=A0A7R9F4K0_9NEOP|nr:unnamed protein product [Timema bartmani]